MKSFIQDTAFEICKAGSSVQRVAQHWRDATYRNQEFDSANVITSARAAAMTLNALADEIEIRMDKPDIALTA